MNYWFELTASLEAKLHEQSVPFFQRHFSAARYVLTKILPVIVKTGRRPVIFSRFAGMGDILCSIPAALELKKRHPGATFIYNCDASSACLPRMGGVTEFITSCREIGLVSHWYRRLLGGFYSFSSDDDQFAHDHKEHFLQSYARLNGVIVSGEHPRLSVDLATRQKVAELRVKWKLEARPLILIHPGPSYPVKHWPQDSWAALIHKIKKDYNAQIAQLGAHVGSYASTAADQFLPVPGVVSLVNQLTLPETIELIAQADLFIGIDSGLLHIAASTHTPSVGLWGPTSANLLYLKTESLHFVTSGVSCQGCHHRFPRLHWFTNCPYQIKCMREIPLEKVFESCMAVLHSESQRPATQTKPPPPV
jgi:ADP-heptose:LPS heptosyltransferase